MIVFSPQQKIEQEDHLQLLQLTASSGMRKTSCCFFFLSRQKNKRAVKSAFSYNKRRHKAIVFNFVNKLHFVFGRLFGRIKQPDWWTQPQKQILNLRSVDEALIIEVNSSRNHFYLFTVCMLDEIFKEWKCPRSSVNVLCGQLFQTRLDIGGNDLRFISSFLGCRVFNICKRLICGTFKTVEQCVDFTACQRNSEIFIRK